jgi:geranylgeranyl reductase family protein
MQYDVVIVGAGPAGSTAAKFLSEKGLRTLLLEKTKFPRDKPCGGGLQMRILQRFKYLEENNLIDSYSSVMQIHSSSMKHHIDFQHSKPLQAMVLRKTFDEGLVNIAARSGAVLQCGKAVMNIINEKEKIRVSLSDGTIVESRIVIGADGTWSIIAKKIGVNQDYNHIGVCVNTEYPLGHETIHYFYGDERVVHIHLQPHGLAGYGWVFPKKECVNIGVVEFRQAINPSTQKKNLQVSYAQYLQTLKKQHLAPKNLPVWITRGGTFPTCPAKKLTADHVLLCGDAGGLVNPMTGEGIFYAMCSGEIAAKTANKSLENNKTDAYSLGRYQRKWNHEFHGDFSLLSHVSKRWGRNVDYLVQLVSKDQKLIDIACDAIPSFGGIQQEKWRLARRFIATYCKNRLRMI